MVNEIRGRIEKKGQRGRIEEKGQHLNDSLSYFITSVHDLACIYEELTDVKFMSVCEQLYMCITLHVGVYFVSAWYVRKFLWWWHVHSGYNYISYNPY